MPVDEQDIRRISGNQTPLAHEARHVSGGADAFLSTDVIEAIVKRILETGASTTLAFAAIADGEFLKRSGATITSGTPTAPTVSTLTKITTDVPCGNTANATALLTYSVAGGTLGTANLLYLYASGVVSSRNGSATDDSLTLRLKYDTTTVTLAVADGDSDAATSAQPFVAEAWLSGDGATNSQIG